jgi:hypothetical protein
VIYAVQSQGFAVNVSVFFVAKSSAQILMRAPSSDVCTDPQDQAYVGMQLILSVLLSLRWLGL